MTIMNITDLAAIADKAKKDFPKETCGLVAGITEKNVREVKKIYFLTNAEDSEEKFSMIPEEQLAAINDMRANKIKLLGNWHSHPKMYAYPSNTDIRLAYDNALIYMIISMKNETPELNAYIIKDGNVIPEEICFV